MITQNMLYFFLETHMENQPIIDSQNTQQIGQNPINLPPVNSVPEKPKINYWIVSTVVLVVILLGVVVFLLVNRSQYKLTSSNQAVSTPYPTDTTQDNIVSTPAKWPKITLTDTVVFIGLKYVLNLSAPTGNNIRPFNNEITQNYKSIGQALISPDNNKLLFTAYGDPPQNGIQYIASLDGKILEKIDMAKVKSNFEKQYEVSIYGWSLDPSKLILHARDVQNFLDNRCCEGGDYRASKQIIASLDIDTNEVKEIFSITASPVGIMFYDPSKNIFVYTDSSLGGGKGHLVELSSKNETAFDDYSLINYGGNKTYFVTTDGNRRHLGIYSIYKPATPIAEITLDEPQNTDFTNWLIWSPDNKYFAIRVLNTDNTYSDKLKIYDKNGKLVLSTNTNMGDGSVFSSDSRYLLSSSSRDIGGGNYKSFWEAIDVTTGQRSIKEFSSSDLGTAIFWFK